MKQGAQGLVAVEHRLEVQGDLILMVQAATEMERAAVDLGAAYGAEIFADRAYEEDGTLLDRSKPGAVLHDGAEAAAWIAETKVQVVPLSDPATGEVPAVHLALSDSTGDSAVIEYTDDEATVWHSPDYKVMTNSPTYDQQLELLATIEGFGGDAPLPQGV